MTLSIIVAINRQNGIGFKNKLLYGRSIHRSRKLYGRTQRLIK